MNVVFHSPIMPIISHVKIIYILIYGPTKKNPLQFRSLRDDPGVLVDFMWGKNIYII